MKKGLIGTWLVQHGLLTQEDLERAQAIQKEKGGSLDEILIGTGVLSESSYQKCLASVYGLSFFSKEQLFFRTISPSLLLQISYRVAMRHLLLPIELSKDGNRLLLAAQAPLKKEVQLELMQLSGATHLSICLSSREHLLDAIRKQYGAHLVQRSSQKIASLSIHPEESKPRKDSFEINPFALHREGFCPSCGVPYVGNSLSCGQCGRTEAEAALDPYIDRTLDGRWKLTRLLSQGGMGLIYQATDLHTSAQVAVKVLRNQFRSSPLEIERFHNEAQILRSLHHPKIVDTFAFGYEESLGFYLVMELLEGKDLYEYQFRLVLPISVLFSIFIEVCEGMEYAHSQGIIHRDLKPENIFLLGGIEDFKGVKVFDFGIARLVHGQRRLTQPGVVMGTPEYIAPEQAQNGPIDHRTDVYALSVIFYEFLTGRRLFEAENAFSYLMKHVYAPPTPMHLACRRTIPRELEQLVMQGLAKDPNQRIASMRAYKEALVHLRAKWNAQEAQKDWICAGMVQPAISPEFEAADTEVDRVVVDADDLPIVPPHSGSFLSPIEAAIEDSMAAFPVHLHSVAQEQAIHPLQLQGMEPDPASAPTEPEVFPDVFFEHKTMSLQPAHVLWVSEHESTHPLLLWMLVVLGVFLSMLGFWFGMLR